MKSLLASTVLAAAVLAPAAAHAGTYLGFGIGTSASTDGALGSFDSSGMHSGRVVVGERFGSIISLEGGLGYFGIGNSGRTYDAMSIGVAAKLALPFTPVFDAFVRLGVEETKLSPDSGSFDPSGSGWTGGVGLEYRFASFGLWADYSKHNISFDENVGSAAASMLTVGATIPL